MDRLKPLHCFDESLAAFAREIEVGTKKKRGEKKKTKLSRHRSVYDTPNCCFAAQKRTVQFFIAPMI